MNRLLVVTQKPTVEITLKAIQVIMELTEKNQSSENFRKEK
jgi:hypothetical protein